MVIGGGGGGEEGAEGVDGQGEGRCCGGDDEGWGEGGGVGDSHQWFGHEDVEAWWRERCLVWEIEKRGFWVEDVIEFNCSGKLKRGVFGGGGGGGAMERTNCFFFSRIKQ